VAVEHSRHRVPDAPPPPVDPPASTGGRRRAEDQPSDWQAYREWRARDETQEQQTPAHNGQHSGPAHNAPAPVVHNQPVYNPPVANQPVHNSPVNAGWSTDPETTGAHAAGRSVTELLAAHGNQEPPRHHRRRAD
jgi:hypothetical protein